jgi:hypothetical protein
MTMKNLKAQIHADWLEAKAKTDSLCLKLDDAETLNRRACMKLYSQALQTQQDLYFELTGKREPKQKRQTATQ